MTAQRPAARSRAGRRARADRHRGPRRPGRRWCSTRASRSSPRRSRRAAVPDGPNSASSGWAAITMNRPGRQSWGGRAARGRRRNAHPTARHEAGRGPVGASMSCAAPVPAVPFRPRLRSSPPTSEVSFVSGASGAVTPPRRLLVVELGEHLRGVALGLDLGPGPDDAALGVDEERGPRRAPVGLAVVLLLDPRAVRLGGLVRLVGEQDERQVELLAERLLARGALRADAPDVGAAVLERLVGIAELAGLDRAAGGVVLRIEVEDRPAAAPGRRGDGWCPSRRAGRPRVPGRPRLGMLMPGWYPRSR